MINTKVEFAILNIRNTMSAIINFSFLSNAIISNSYCIFFNITLYYVLLFESLYV